jgi:hypothetical protein
LSPRRVAFDWTPAARLQQDDFISGLLIEILKPEAMKPFPLQVIVIECLRADKREKIFDDQLRFIFGIDIRKGDLVRVGSDQAFGYKNVSRVSIPLHHQLEDAMETVQWEGVWDGNQSPDCRSGPDQGYFDDYGYIIRHGSILP